MSWTIAEVIGKLESASPDASVRFAFGGVVPTVVDCWRGCYSEPALGWLSDSDRLLVRDLLHELKLSIDGREYTGPRGSGDFTFTAMDTLHIDNPGECTHTEISDIKCYQYEVVIHTKGE